MRYWFSLLFGILFLVGAMHSTVMYSRAEAADTQWYWISSDNNYSKFYDPAQVKVQDAFGGIATRITAVTKTSYSYGGAKETLDNYGIKDVVPNNLAYSLAAVQICLVVRSARPVPPGGLPMDVLTRHVDCDDTVQTANDGHLRRSYRALIALPNARPALPRPYMTGAGVAVNPYTYLTE